MALPKPFLLPGPSSNLPAVPQLCSACGFETLFRQPDFNRNLGLWLVGIAAVLTVVFAWMGMSWWVIWSPMPGFFILDRAFAKFSDDAVLCYKCEHIHRVKVQEKAAQEKLRQFPEFDLELYDRIHYQDRHGQSVSQKSPDAFSDRNA